jgi:K+-transporting ATPase KdpF subunit
MNTTILLLANATNSHTIYAIGAVIALFILGYLLYSLVKPEKF